jgi:hypothetical protein
MLILRVGRLVDQRILSGPSAGGSVVLRLAMADARFESVMKGESGLAGLVVEGLTARFRFAGDETARALLLRRLVEAGLPIADFAMERERLQETYLTRLGEKAGSP